MKKRFTFIIAVLMLLSFMTPTMAGWGQTYTELFSISSADVVNNSNYAAYSNTVSNRDWVVTFGGNNKSVGTNSGNRYKCNLGSYTKYAVNPVTSAQVASAFACKTSLSNVSKIKYTFNGGSNQTNTKVYLIYSANDGTYSQISLTSGTQGASISSGTEYTFSASSGYFALLFEATNSSGNWRIDDVVITFYEVSGGGSSVTAPTFDPVSGSSVVSGTAVHLSAAQGTTIYYTSGTGNVDDPTISSSQYDNNTGITVDAEHTTIKAIASDGNNTSSVATATYTILTPITTMQGVLDASTLTTQQVAITFNDWVISGNNTGNNGSNATKAWLTDNNGYGCVIYESNTNIGFTAENVLTGTVICNLKRNAAGYAEISGITSSTENIMGENIVSSTLGNVTVIENVTINDLAGENTGSVVKLNNLTCISGNGSIGYTMEDADGNTISAKNLAYSGLTLVIDRKYNLTGIFEKSFSNTKIIYPRGSEDCALVTTPYLIAHDVTLDYDATSGSIAYTIMNPVDGVNINATTEADWISEITVGESSITFATTQNNGDANRTATFTLTYGTETKSVTVTQKTIDFTTLPFVWEGGTSAELTAVVGVTANGLGSDYAQSNAPYRVKFDTNGDYIIIKTNEQPGVVTLGLKKFGSSNTVIKVQGSDNGQTFTDVESLTCTASNNNTQTLSTTNSFDANVRYVKISRYSGSNVGVGPISIAKPKYAITLNSPTTGGTFTADKATAAEGETVTLTPEAATHYVFTSWIVCKTGEPSTTVNVDNNQFVMPAYPVTVSASFTALQERTIIIPTEIEDNVVVDVTGNKAYAGDEVTIMIYAPTNKFLTSLTVTGYTTSNLITLSPEVSSEIDEYTFTMPDENVTIAATFAGEFTVQFSVNGESAGSQNVTAGQSVTLSSQEPPTGFIFAGWTINQTNFDNIITGDSYTPTADVTLYAVYSKTITGAPVEHVVILDGEATGLSSTLLSSETTISENGFSYKAIGVKYTNVQSNATNAFVPENKTILGGKDASVCIYNSTAFGDGITKFEIYENYGASASVTVGVNFGVNQITSYNAGSSNTWSQAIVPNTVYDASSALPEGAKYFCFGITKDKNAQVQFRITYTTISSTTEYYTRVQSIAGTTTEISTVTPADLITVPAGAVLTITGACTGGPENLIIKDGGQLKVYTTGAKDGGVQATVEKYIGKYTADDNGWNFIASPLTSAFAPDATMTSNTYDLYQLNNTKWENYKDNEGHTNANPGFSLVNGHGYLYANSGDVTLSFAGAIKPFNKVDNTANQVLVNAGWNLIGNPYTFDVYVDQSYYSISQAQAGITANTDASNADAIKPCTSILVYAKSEGSVEFLENLPVSSTGNHSNIQMVLAHNVNVRGDKRVETIDNAIVSFNEGSQLEKFYFGNPSASIFIPQNGEDYAIAFSDRQGDVPLYFKANETGTYTISFAGDEMSLNGIYLIDILAEEEIDLSVNPSYTFIGSPADRMARFKIVFRNANGDGTSDIFAYQNGNDIIVSGEGELQIFDVMGRMVSRQRVNGVETVNAMPYGVYIFKLNGMTQKIVVR